MVSKLLKTIAVCTCDTLKWSKTIYIYRYLVNNGRKLLFAWYNSITYDTSENDTLKAPISICTEQLESCLYLFIYLFLSPFIYLILILKRIDKTKGGKCFAPKLIYTILHTHPKATKFCVQNCAKSVCNKHHSTLKNISKIDGFCFPQLHCRTSGSRPQATCVMSCQPIIKHQLAYKCMLRYDSRDINFYLYP